jgi:hypothetical protein
MKQITKEFSRLEIDQNIANIKYKVHQQLTFRREVDYSHHTTIFRETQSSCMKSAGPVEIGGKK